jgi:hypothetical protein
VTLIALSNFTAADQINEKVEKRLQNSSSQKEKSILFKTKPLSPPVKSNELGKRIQNYVRELCDQEAYRREFRHLLMIL